MQPDLLCRSCRDRLDAVLWSVGRHPGCGPNPPIPEAAYAQLVAHLFDQLGATGALGRPKEGQR